MSHKALNMSLDFCVVELIVSVKSILRLNVIKNGILFTKNISIASNTSLLIFENSLGNLMRYPVTQMGLFLVVFPFRSGTSFPRVVSAFSMSLVSTGQS